jgi:drug/metabolite transporter (DMT)-like permease
VKGEDVSRKAVLLFAATSATSAIWGSSFLFIRVAAEHLPPSAVVFGRALLGAVFLLPLAMRTRASAACAAASCRSPWWPCSTWRCPRS